MRQLRIEQVEYAVGRLVRLAAFREMTQTQLEQASGVTQSTISKIFSHSQEGNNDTYCPREEVLAKLFQALGLKLADILNESDCLPDKILGYLATPLTALSETSHKELRRIVKEIRNLASEKRFEPPPLEIYWPGDHTHPLDHVSLPARQVYLTDRSRASTHDFIILFCGDASYGLGQENEIATQAGIPAIRLIPPKGISRMMTGSFVRAIDIKYSGSLDAAIRFDREEFLRALQDIRKLHFRHRALYHGLNSDAFGSRLRRLVDDRSGAYVQFADDLGISLDYLHTLMQEPFSVSNPSARLLNRIATLLGTRVGYLLGESGETDPIWVESNASWRKWIDASAGIDAGTAIQMRDKWRDAYQMARRTRELSTTSFRNNPKLMEVKDWDKQYQDAAKAQIGPQPIQTKLV
jgi:transcriptional regulator with XRE-family HTH domain